MMCDTAHGKGDLVSGLVTRSDIEAADRRISGHVRRTPVVEIKHGLWLKLESMQHTGTFKPRGMFNRALAHEVPSAGLVIASGGNAGLAMAYVGRKLGHRVEVFVPETTPRLKIEQLLNSGAVVMKVGDTYAQALTASKHRCARTGAAFAHAYDQPEVCAGQGTLALELSEQVPDADTVMVSVGGGGLIAGIAAWYAGEVSVIGVESEGCPTLHAARLAGEPVDVKAVGVAMDSLGAERIGEIAWALSQAGYVTDSLLVSDDDIMAARRWLWQETRIVVEAGTAAALAAIRSHAYTPATDETVAVVVCGANTDPSDLV